jgi:hypothetical protein
MLFVLLLVLALNLLKCNCWKRWYSVCASACLLIHSSMRQCECYFCSLGVRMLVMLCVEVPCGIFVNAKLIYLWNVFVPIRVCITENKILWLYSFMSLVVYWCFLYSQQETLGKRFQFIQMLRSTIYICLYNHNKIRQSFSPFESSNFLQIILCNIYYHFRNKPRTAYS